MNHQWLKFAGKIPPHRVTISPCDKTFCSSLRYVVGRSCFISSSSIISNGRVHLHQSFSIKNTYKYVQLRNFATKSNKHHQRRRYRSKVPIYMLTFITMNAYGIYAHTDDTLFYYTYPLPFAMDIGQGPSMYPTMGTSCNDNNDGKEEEFNLYLRDTLSYRLPLSSISRKWKKGDVVTYYNPITKYMCTKRIIGVEGDTVCVFGEYAQEFLNHNDISNESKDMPEYSWLGVPHIEGLPFQCYCDMIASKQQKKINNDDKVLPQSCTIIVPKNHVWLEGDNPLYSTDCRHYGPVNVSALRGRLVYRLWPSESERSKSLVADSSRPSVPTFT